MLDEWKPCNLSATKIYALAEEKASCLGYASGGDLHRVVEELGGTINYLDIDNWFATEDGSIEVRSKGDFTINLSSFIGEMRNRFTIAHELGHYYLHSKEGEIPGKAKRFGRDPLETEAHRFAAAFLMPENEFRSIYKEFQGRVVSLASHFLVSVSAVEVRIKEINKRVALEI